jgi:hypothetical protein
MTSIERTAYPRFKRLITARELHVFFTPSEEERAWVEEVTDSDEHQLALLVALKSYQRMGCFPKAYDVPVQVVEFVRRAVELPVSTLPVYASGRTAERHRSRVRERCGVRYDGQVARSLAEETMRVAAASKNNPADLINIALEKLVEANLEIPRFSTLDAMASTVRGQVNEEILAGIRGRTTEEERRRLLGLPDVIGLDRKTLFNALKQNPGRATWSHFKRLKSHLEWVDGLGDTAKWLEGVASTKVADFAGEAEAQDAATLKDYAEGKRVALIACLAAKARIDWSLIETHFKDLMRATVSIREGAISSTLLLKRLRSGSKKNATYTAFREVGRVIRTVQLLRFLSDAPLRGRVTAATNKVEAFNGFSDWVRFGQRGTVAHNDPGEQEKDVKFTSLLANLLIFHNTLDIADVVRQLQAEGEVIDPLDLAQVSPYLTEHVNRFGVYSTHEIGIAPEDYDTRLDVDFSALEDDQAPAA